MLQLYKTLISKTTFGVPCTVLVTQLLKILVNTKDMKDIIKMDRVQRYIRMSPGPGGLSFKKRLDRFGVFLWSVGG